jgi:hypothetical protein
MQMAEGRPWTPSDGGGARAIYLESGSPALGGRSHRRRSWMFPLRGPPHRLRLDGFPERKSVDAGDWDTMGGRAGVNSNELWRDPSDRPPHGRHASPWSRKTYKNGGRGVGLVHAERTPPSVADPVLKLTEHQKNSGARGGRAHTDYEL